MSQNAGIIDAYTNSGADAPAFGGGMGDNGGLQTDYMNTLFDSMPSSTESKGMLGSLSQLNQDFVRTLDDGRADFQAGLLGSTRAPERVAQAESNFFSKPENIPSITSVIADSKPKHTAESLRRADLLFA